MSHPCLLCFQVKQVIRGRRHLNGYALGDLQPKLGELIYFVRVIGKQAQAFYAKFPAELKSIGGKAIISIDYYDEKTFPNLATVGEDMMFQTGYDYYGSRGPAVVLYPALKQVGGTLELRPIGPTPWGDNENTGYLNQTLENLDFLSSLEKVGGIRIHDHGKLASYEAIKKAILTCPEEKWSVENNLYNPTYKQLVEDQQWIKPAIQE